MQSRCAGGVQLAQKNVPRRRKCLPCRIGWLQRQKKVIGKANNRVLLEAFTGAVREASRLVTARNRSHVNESGMPHESVANLGPRK
jgi:hypothetical protein